MGPLRTADSGARPQPARRAPGTGRAARRGAVAFFLVRGALALVFGVAILAAGSAMPNLLTFIACYAIVAGLITLRWVVTAHRGGVGAVVMAALWLVAGAALLLRWPLRNLVGEGVLLDVLGVVAILSGLLRLSGRCHDDQFSRDRPRARYRLVLGPLDIVVGVVVLLANQDTAIGIRIGLGVWGLATGTFLLLDAFMLRRDNQSEAKRSG